MAGRLDKATIEVDAIMTNPPEPRQFAVLDETGSCIAHLAYDAVKRVLGQYDAMEHIRLTKQTQRNLGGKRRRA